MAKKLIVGLDGSRTAEQERTLAREWGRWRLDPRNLSLDLGEDGWEYWVDLETCCTSAEVLDWICQVRHKSWVTPEILAGLVAALDSILDPQDTLCSGGASKEMTRAEIGERVRRFARSHPSIAVSRRPTRRTS